MTKTNLSFLELKCLFVQRHQTNASVVAIHMLINLGIEEMKSLNVSFKYEKSLM